MFTQIKTAYIRSQNTLLQDAIGAASIVLSCWLPCIFPVCICQSYLDLEIAFPKSVRSPLMCVRICLLVPVILP